MKNPKRSEKEIVKLIAEIGTSHNGDLSRAAELINAAADSGADCIKTQIVFAEEIIHPNTGEVMLPGGNIRLYDRFIELEQDFDFYLHLKDLTEKAGLEFFASPFGFRSLDWLLKLGCSTIKIASPELNHFPLLKRASAAGKKIILSTGVSMLRDIEAALAVTGTKNSALLHCVTSYPAPEEEYNLNLIPRLSKLFQVPVGVSDHSLDPVLVPAVAAAVGAVYVEKHITLDKNDGGLDDPIALTPDSFSKMSAAVRGVERLLKTSPQSTQSALKLLEEQFGTERITLVLGSGIKDLAPSEAPNYGRTNRSVHALSALPPGTVLTTENTALLRTEQKLQPGLRPELYDKILGRKVVNHIESGEGITEGDIE